MNNSIKSLKVKIYYDNGQKKYERWYLNGKRHREDGPALQYFHSNGQKRYEYWYLRGKFHREDGPALQTWLKNGEKIYGWFLNNKGYSREEWINKLKEIDSEHYKEQEVLYNAEKYNL